ncbi:MAG: prealbumin-like fold domain-containing protein [Lachnospiraceae bacterium]|nr:prealbumin-like fold domain-containing protein [Lachnospiraceae bacterium]
MKALKISRVIAVVLALLIGWQAVECTVITAKIVKASGDSSDEGASYAGEGGSLGAVDKMLLEYADAMEDESLDGGSDDRVTDVIDGTDIFNADEEAAVYEGGVAADEYADYYMASETQPAQTASTLQASQVTIKIEDKDSTAASKLLLSPAKPDFVLYKSADDVVPKPAAFTAAEIEKLYTKITSAVTTIKYDEATGVYTFGENGEAPKELTKGHYLLFENSAPTGYYANNSVYYFSIDEKGLQYTGTIKTADNKTDETDKWPADVNGATISSTSETISYARLPGQIKITRTDDAAKNYAVYQVRHNNGTTAVVDIAKLTIGTDGTVTASKDDYGKDLLWETDYILTEVSEAKAGYNRDTQTHTVRIAPQFSTVTADGTHFESQIAITPNVGSTNVQLVVTNFDDGIKHSGNLLFPSKAVKGMTIRLTQGSTSTDYVTDDSGMVSLTLASGTQTSYTVTPKQLDPYFPVQPFTLTMGTDGKVSVNTGSTTRKTGNIGSTRVPEIDVVSSTPTAGSPAVVNIHPSVTRISFGMYVNTAEAIDSSYRSFTMSGEYGTPDTVTFTLYGTYTSGTNVSNPVSLVNKNGKSVTDGTVTTDAGVVTAYAMPYRSADDKEYYYIKYRSKSGSSNMTEPSGSTDLIRLSMPSSSSGTCTLVAGSTNKTMSTPSGLPTTPGILGTIKHGTVAFKVVDHNDTAKGLAGAKFEVYRLYEGDDSTNDDGRGDVKLDADDDEYDDSADSSSSSVYTYKLGKATILDDIAVAIMAKDPFALRAYAAVATSNYPQTTNNEWQRIAAGITSASDGTVTINGLVPGQRYLIRQTTAPSGYSATRNPVVILTKKDMGSTTTANISTVTDYNGAQNSSTSAVRQSGATMAWLQGTGTATSSKSGTSSTVVGSGTAANAASGAGDARGSATGDESRLWLHLIIMLIAFDALVADLLFISRRKKVYAPVRSDRTENRER